LFWWGVGTDFGGRLPGVSKPYGDWPRNQKMSDQRVYGISYKKTIDKILIKKDLKNKKKFFYKYLN
jgi:hypothetical protein